MSADPEVLRGLLERVNTVKKAYWPLSFGLHRVLVLGQAPEIQTWWTSNDHVLWRDGTSSSVHGWPDYTASVDDALGLLNRVLPEHGYRIQRAAPHMKPVATLFAPIALPEAPIDDGRSWSKHIEGTGATDALAILAALLKALLPPPPDLTTEAQKGEP